MVNHPFTEPRKRVPGQSPVLAVIGGTGKEGNALAARFAKAGVHVIIGSREAAKGEKAAREMNTRLGVNHVEGTSNRAAAEKADVVLLSVPYAGMQPILQDLREAVQGKVVINIASSLDPAHKSRAQVPPAGSTTAEVQQFFGEHVQVLAAFQNIAPEKLEGDAPIDSDVLVCGADKDTRTTVIGLIHKTGMEAFDAGALANAVAVETLTAVLIAVNIKYKVKGAGIRLTGVPR
jgi:8-hydroxy-5-deazaflavin:NADPH oxidoreductase